MQPAIVVSAYSRPWSLSRLLGSLDAASYTGQAPLVISVDGDGHPDVHRIANEHEWRHGPKRVIRHEKRLGLPEHLRGCCDLSQEYGSVILLEDDLYAAPGFYGFAQAALEYYADEPRVGGVSLACPAFNETAWQPFLPMAGPGDAFFMQVLYFGGAWTADQWSRFRDWLAASDDSFDDPRLPSNVRRWPRTSSMKRDVFTQAVERDLYYVHPRESFVTNFADGGTNLRFGTNNFQVPLSRSLAPPRLRPFADAGEVYDAWFEASPAMLAPALEPWLQGRPFCVDLYGSKPPASTREPFTLTVRPTRSALCSFGLRMRPREANVLAGVPGDDIRLAPTADVTGGRMPGRVLRAEAAFSAAHVDGRFLRGIIGEKLVRRLRNILS